MAELIKFESIKEPRKRNFIGRFGFSLFFGRHEVFIGVVSSPIVVYPVRRLPKVAKQGVATVVEYSR